MMEFDEIVVKETPGLCRCCLSEGCYKDLGSEYSWMNETEVYADMLLECFDISITQHNEGPNGPNRLICEVCITRLRDACNFKKQVLDSEKKFIDMMGRGEFRPKMLIYQAQMKAEDPVEPAADDTEVEYLEDDIDFGDDDLIKDETEPSVSDITVSTLPVKGKRGRPRKTALVKPEKRMKVKLDDKKKAVAKDQSVADKMIEERRKEELATLLRIVIQNTDIIPFRWHKSKYMCFYCRALFVESCSLKHHTTTEHKDIKLREIILRSLYRRGRTKLDVTNLNCKPCDTEMKNFSSFLKHLSIVHSLSFQTDAAQTFDCFSLSDGGMCCLHCGQYFTFFGPLLLHTYKYHIDQFLCEVCGLGFVGKHNVHNHVKQIHNIKSCKDCDKTFQTQYALLNHTENVHKKEKLQCPICPEILGNRYLKKRHLALVHDCKKSQFVCELCSKIFTRNNKYIQHKLRVHFKEKNFTCEYCGHKAFNMDSLKCHMVCHNDARPFKCEVCEKTFRRKKTLVIHMRTHRTEDVVVVNINSF